MAAKFSSTCLLFLFLLICRPTSAQVYQWIDENGRTVFSNLAPPAGAKVIQQKQVYPEPTSSTDLSEEDLNLVNAYYNFSRTMVSDVVRFKKGLLPTKETIDQQSQVVEELTKNIHPRLSGDIDGPISAKLSNFSKMADKHQKEIDKRGSKDEKYYRAFDQAQFCRYLTMKTITENYLDKKGIDYQKLEFPEDACTGLFTFSTELETSTGKPITASYTAAKTMKTRDAEVSDIGIKTTSNPDSSGDVWFAIKANVKNEGVRSRSVVTLQAIDKEGFELKDITLVGEISPGSSKVLTDKSYMKYSEYRKILKWQVKN